MDLVRKEQPLTVKSPITDVHVAKELECLNMAIIYWLVCLAGIANTH